MLSLKIPYDLMLLVPAFLAIPRWRLMRGSSWVHTFNISIGTDPVEQQLTNDDISFRYSRSAAERSAITWYLALTRAGASRHISSHACAIARRFQPLRSMSPGYESSKMYRSSTIAIVRRITDCNSITWSVSFKFFGAGSTSVHAGHTGSVAQLTSLSTLVAKMSW